MHSIPRNDDCVCSRCIHPVCPNPDAEPPHDEVIHEIGNTLLSVKIPKCARRFQSDDTGRELARKLSFDFDCADAEGQKCRSGCTKLHVIPDQQMPPKQPEEETFTLKTVRRILHNDGLRNKLEIQFKGSRNYVPLPDLGPSPPVIVPKQKLEPRKKRKRKQMK